MAAELQVWTSRLSSTLYLRALPLSASANVDAYFEMSSSTFAIVPGSVLARLSLDQARVGATGRCIRLLKIAVAF